MINVLNPDFDKFYMGKANLSLYESEGIEYCQYPRQSNYVKYHVVYKDDNNLGEFTTYEPDEILEKFPNVKIPIVFDHTSTWKGANGSFAHVTTSLDKDDFNNEKQKYQKFTNALHDHFMKYLLENELPVSLDKFGENVFSRIYSEAWQNGHSDGYSAVVYQFRELSAFAEELLEAAGKIGK